MKKRWWIALMLMAVLASVYWFLDEPERSSATVTNGPAEQADAESMTVMSVEDDEPAAVLTVLNTKVELSSGDDDCEGACTEYSAQWLVFPDQPKLNDYFAQLRMLPKAESITEALRLDGRAFIQEADGESWQHSTEMKRLSGLPNVTVIELSVYAFTGGAHGNSSIVTANIDNRTMQVLTLDDIVKPGRLNAFWNVVRKEHRQWAKVNIDGDLSTWPFVTTEMFLLRPKAIELQYDPYAIGPYAVGAPRLRIPYDQLIDILEPEWLPVDVAAH